MTVDVDATGYQKRALGRDHLPSRFAWQGLRDRGNTPVCAIPMSEEYVPTPVTILPPSISTSNCMLSEPFVDLPRSLGFCRVSLAGDFRQPVGQK